MWPNEGNSWLPFAPASFPVRNVIRESSLHTVDVSPVSEALFVNIFSNSVVRLFDSLMVSFAIY